MRRSVRRVGRLRSSLVRGAAAGAALVVGLGLAASVPVAQAQGASSPAVVSEPVSFTVQNVDGALVQS